MVMRITSRLCPAAALLVVLGSSVPLGGSGRVLTLLEAVKTGQESAVRAVLKERAGVNETDADGTTALHWAVHHGTPAMVDLLLRAGAMVSAQNRYGVTPLSLACERGHAAIVQRLLTAGADPNFTRPSGETVLMTAARSGNAQIIRALLTRGADVHRRTGLRGQTALMLAAVRGNVAAIQALVEGGARVADRAYEPNVVFQGTPDLARADAKGATNISERLESYTALLFAVRSGHIPAVVALLDAGGDVNDRGTDNVPALSIAAINAHWELAALLLDRGANPNESHPGGTALHDIARTRTIRNTFVPPPRSTGVLSSIDLAKKMIAAGADVDARMERGELAGSTPLLIAAKPADPEMMALLVANGADPLARAADGTTILMQAAGIGQTANIGDDDAAMAAVKLGLSWGVDVNATNDAGNTVLHAAAFRGYNPMVQLLADHGARLDVKNTRGQIPLFVANGEFRANLLTRRPETTALLARIMQEKGIDVPPLPTIDEVRAMFVERGPTVSCPEPPTAVSVDGKPVRVSYGAAVVTAGGDGGSRATCLPASGSEFPVGASTVACRAVDILGRSDSCTFIVRVLPSPETK